MEVKSSVYVFLFIKEDSDIVSLWLMTFCPFDKFLGVGSSGWIDTLIFRLVHHTGCLLSACVGNITTTLLIFSGNRDGEK